MTEPTSKENALTKALLRGCGLLLTALLAVSAGCSDKDRPLSAEEEATLDREWGDLKKSVIFSSDSDELRHGRIAAFLEKTPTTWQRRPDAEEYLAQLKAKMEGKPDPTKPPPPKKTWADPATGLIWQREPANEARDWKGAKSHCANLDFADQKDWRLPNKKELQSLLRGCDESLTADRVKCPKNEGPGPEGCYWPDELSGKCDFYWSATDINGPDNAWSIDYSEGNVHHYGTVHKDPYVRCVRSEQKAAK